jgi:hypothetical protein
MPVWSSNSEDSPVTLGQRYLDKSSKWTNILGDGTVFSNWDRPNLLKLPRKACPNHSSSSSSSLHIICHRHAKDGWLPFYPMVIAFVHCTCLDHPLFSFAFYLTCVDKHASDSSHVCTAGALGVEGLIAVIVPFDRFSMF